MIWPPSVVSLRIHANGQRKKILWLPLCLIWPPVVLIALLLAPLAVPVLWLAGGRGRLRRTVLAGPALFRLFCALRGLCFEAGNPGNDIRMAIF